MTVVNQLMTLLCPKQNPQHRERVNLPEFLFRVITREIALITQRPKPDPLRHLSVTPERSTDSDSLQDG